MMLFAPLQVWSHARLVIPSPRDSNAGNKTAPCGLTAKPATATHTFTAGQVVPIQIIETVDHPGRYLLSLSLANDQNFQSYNFPVIADIQGGAPHTYNATITIPNVTCDNCTLQMIQVMDDNAVNPYYYSCADIQITAAGGTPTPTPPPAPGPGAQSGTGAIQPTQQPGFGCGMVAKNPNDSLFMYLALFILPLMVCFRLRRYSRV